MGQQTRRRPLKGLSKAAETAVRKRSVFGRLKLSRWLKILRELAQYDEAGELIRARTKKMAVISGVTLILVVLLLLIVGGDKGFLVVSMALAGLALTAAGFLIHSLVRRRQLKDLDLADDFRNVLIPFLIAIREDIASKDKVRLKLDLAGPSDAKVVRRGEVKHKGKKKINETVYSDPWCHLDAPLTAGSHITLDIANTYTRRDVRWKNPRGKSKQKFKWKKMVVVRAGMFPDASRFAFDRAAVEKGSGQGGLRLKKRFEGEAVAMKTKRKFKSVGSAPPAESIQPKEIVAMFLKLESLIRPVPTGSQQT
jgi:hypothetical protein